MGPIRSLSVLFTFWPFEQSPANCDDAAPVRQNNHKSSITPLELRRRREIFRCRRKTLLPRTIRVRKVTSSSGLADNIVSFHFWKTVLSIYSVYYPSSRAAIWPESNSKPSPRFKQIASVKSTHCAFRRSPIGRQCFTNRNLRLLWKYRSGSKLFVEQ